MQMNPLKRLTIVIVIALIAMVMTVGVLAATGPMVTFTKKVSNATPTVGDVFTVTLEFVNNHTEPLNVIVSDPNPARLYLSILTSTITGGAVYSPTIDAVVWNGTLNVGSLPHKVQFQMRATGIPTATIESGYPVTNTAYMSDAGSTGSLPPGSLPGSLPDQVIATAAIRILPKTQYISVNTTQDPDGSQTLNAPVNVLVEDQQLKIELPQGTIISGSNLPAGGVRLAYIANHTSDPTGSGIAFAGRRFTLELVANSAPFTRITPVSFNPPMTLTVFYDRNQLAAEKISPSEIKIQYRNSSGAIWQSVPETDIVERGAGTTAQNSYVKFRVGHLTDFALVGPGPHLYYFPTIRKNQ